MEEMRRAALTIHALQEVDRRWILEQLAPQARQTLQHLLAELAALGIPADSALIEEALQSGAGVDRAQEQALWRRELGAFDTERLQEALEGEPPALVARVLGAGLWPWEHDFLARLPAHRREAVLKARGALAARAGSREFDEWLAQRLQKRLASTMDAVSQEASE